MIAARTVTVDVKVDTYLLKDNEIDLFRHHNVHVNNNNTKVIFKKMTILGKINCIRYQGDHMATIKLVDGI